MVWGSVVVRLVPACPGHPLGVQRRQSPLLLRCPSARHPTRSSQIFNKGRRHQGGVRAAGRPNQNQLRISLNQPSKTVTVGRSANVSTARRRMLRTQQVGAGVMVRAIQLGSSGQRPGGGAGPSVASVNNRAVGLGNCGNQQPELLRSGSPVRNRPRNHRGSGKVRSSQP